MDQRINGLIEAGDVSSLQRLHFERAWTDLNMVVASEKGPDGKTWYYTAMAIAAICKQLKVMRWLIEEGAKMDEIREWHHRPSLVRLQELASLRASG